MERYDYNEHHVWYHRRHYKRDFEKQLRTYRGFVIPILVADHRDLHANLFEGPPTPNKPQIEGLLQSLGRFAIQPGARTLYVESAIDFFQRHGDDQGHMGDNAWEIADQLQEQLMYIRGEHDGAGTIRWRKSA